MFHSSPSMIALNFKGATCLKTVKYVIQLATQRSSQSIASFFHVLTNICVQLGFLYVMKCYEKLKFECVEYF